MSPPMSLGFHHHPTAGPVFGHFPATDASSGFLLDVPSELSDALFGFVYDPLDHASNAALDDILRLPAAVPRPVKEEGATAEQHCVKKLRVFSDVVDTSLLPRYGGGNRLQLPALPEFRTDFRLPMPVPPPQHLAFVRGSDAATDGGNGSQTKSVQSAAARERRKRITQKTAELSRLIPGAHKMTTAEMLHEGVRHVKLLQAQTGMLTLMHAVDGGSSEKEKTPITAQEQMRALLASGRVQERLAAEGKCLVPRKLVDAMARDKDVRSNPLVNRDLGRFIATLEKKCTVTVSDTPEASESRSHGAPDSSPSPSPNPKRLIPPATPTTSRTKPASPHRRHDDLAGEREEAVKHGGGGGSGRRAAGHLEAADRDTGGDGGGARAAAVPRPVRAPPHPAQQVPRRRVLPPLEVRAGAPCLREVPVRTRHGADAPDAEDPRGAGGQGQGRRQHRPHPGGHRQARLIQCPPDLVDLGLSQHARAL